MITPISLAGAAGLEPAGCLVNGQMLYRLSHTPVEFNCDYRLARTASQREGGNYLLLGCGNGFWVLYILTVLAPSLVAP